MNELALFAGVGGGLLGTHLLGWTPVCAVEINPYCREVLLRRQRDGVLPMFPVWDDATTFDGRPWRGLVDVITGGFPCQPYSLIGKRAGEDDERNLWPDTIRIIREVGPRRVYLENVPGLLVQQYFGTILGDLVESGFRVRWDCIPATAVGAPHRRDRLWIVGDAERAGLEGHPGHGGDGDRPGRDGEGAPRSVGEAGVRRGAEGWAKDPGDGAEPLVGRVAHGVAYRVDRIKAIGNGQVPAVVAHAWRILKP